MGGEQEKFKKKYREWYGGWRIYVININSLQIATVSNLINQRKEGTCLLRQSKHLNFLLYVEKMYFGHDLQVVVGHLSLVPVHV